MPTSSLDLDSFLKKKKYNKDVKTHVMTHTRIGNSKDKIYGGCYSINEENENEFYKLYHKKVFQQNKMEYLTERQDNKHPSWLVDIDLRYAQDVKERQYNDSHIIDLLQLYLTTLESLIECENVEFMIYIFQKPNINITSSEIKDGIHIKIDIIMPHDIQSYVRDKVLEDIDTTWNDINTINSWGSVFDEGISKGYTNWQLYGSRKPGNDWYRLTKIYKCTYDESFELEEMTVPKKINVDLLKNIVARSRNSVEVKYKDEILKLLVKQPKVKLKLKNDKNVVSKPELITCEEEMNEYLKVFLEKCNSEDEEDETLTNTSNYYLKEIHQYTMTLPEDFYDKGSYAKWIRVGWALHKTSSKLLITWLKFSSQSKDFDYKEIPDMCEKWETMSVHSAQKSLTVRSIIYWAREFGDPEKIKKIQEQSINYFVTETLKPGGNTDYNFATVLYNMYKGKYICVNIKHNMWYEYKKHKWHEVDSGTTLRAKISNDMFKYYLPIMRKEVQKLAEIDANTDEWKEQKEKLTYLVNLSTRLKKTVDKDKIMREARELFYDNEFLESQDSRVYLLGFTNGVYDFEENVFRPGRPDDYIVKTTNYDYQPLYTFNEENKKEVHDFMEQLFPVKELRKYMWDHLASTLIGTNENQTFNIYNGSGRNGKSMLVLLMGKVLGDLKGTVPVSLITQKRNQIGSTSSELVALKGVRYAVMQEPSKGDKINEGIMKELTGGDPLQCRALFSNSITYIPQFKLICCLNQLFNIESQDDGTWRRIRVCDFMSKFTENPVKDDADEPYQFKVNKKLEEKFEEWKYIMMALLIEIAKETKGNVNDCNIVLAKSLEYREGQDYIAEFIKEKIEKCDSGVVKKKEIAAEFHSWYQMNYGMANKQGVHILDRELYTYMNKRYGKYNAGWKNIAIIYDDYED